MIRISDIIENGTYMPSEFGLVFFGTVAEHGLSEDIKAENRLLEGLCPARILLSDDWRTGDSKAIIEPAKKPHKEYAYYSPQYLAGKPWSRETTSFAIFSIAYRLITGKLPYLDNVPDELLRSKESIRYIKKMRKENPLDLSGIPASFRNFFAKGLALKLKDRYKEIGDTADEFGELCANFNLTEFSTESDPISETDYGFHPSEFEKMLAQNSSTDFSLDVQRDEEGSLDDLVGLEEVKYYLRHRFLAILKNPEKAKKYKLTIPNGLLLYGPTGCGKSAVAKAIAAESRMNYAIISAKDIASTFVHGTQKILGQLFQQAAIYAPIILIFEEIDTMIPDRNNPDNRKVAEDTNGFLPELSTCAERGIFVIGTTNRPQLMDSAALRTGRFDKKFYIPLPDEQTRTLIFHNYLHDRPIAEHIDYQQLGKMTSAGYISSDIRHICEEAAARAFDNDTIITQDLIEQVIREGGPSVSKNELRSYEEARRYIEPAAKCSAYVNQIGFR